MAVFPLVTPVRVLNPVLLDDKCGPYIHATEAGAKALAIAGVPIGIRSQGQEVVLVISGISKKYIWQNGTADTDLVPLTVDISGKADTTYVDAQDSALNGLISDEATNRTNADSAEASARANADSTEATARANADSAEATARVNGDAATLNSAQAYADSLLVSVYKDQGNFDPSTGLFPTTGGTGSGGAIKKGNAFEASVVGTIGSQDFDIGDTIRALVDAPGQTASNWAVSEHNTQQATETSRGTAKIATSAQATTATDDKTMMTPVKTLAQIADQRKSYTKSVSVSRGTPFLNELLIYYANAGTINTILGTQVTNLLVKTSLGGTYAAPSLPMSITAGATLFIQFDFSSSTYLNGNITITGKDN